jgi:hypothetical protein
MSRNRIEEWDRWIEKEARQPRRPSGLLAQTRAIGPSKPCKIFWPEGSSLKDELNDGDILRAKIETIRTENVSYSSRPMAQLIDISVGRKYDPRAIPRVCFCGICPSAVPPGQRD